MITKKSKQIGFLIYGGGINVRYWLDQIKAEGKKVMLRDGYAEIYS